MVKVKYNGKNAVRVHKIDFYPGDVKDVPAELVFSEDSFSILSEKSEKATQSPSKAKVPKVSK
jgi:hypothetical protein